MNTNPKDLIDTVKSGIEAAIPIVQTVLDTPLMQKWRAVGRTADHFPEIPELRHHLNSWIESHEFIPFEEAFRATGTFDVERAAESLRPRLGILDQENAGTKAKQVVRLLLAEYQDIAHKEQAPTIRLIVESFATLGSTMQETREQLGRLGAGNLQNDDPTLRDDGSPNNPQLLVVRSLLRGRKARTALTALDAIESSTDLSAIDRLSALRLRGSCHLALAEFDEAKVYLGRAIQLNDRDWRSQLNYGRALLAKGDEVEGFRHLDLALKLNPEEPVIAGYMGALVDSSRYRQAQEFASRYQQIDKSDLFIATEAQAWAGVDNFEQAVQLTSGLDPHRYPLSMESRGRALLSIALRRSAGKTTAPWLLEEGIRVALEEARQCFRVFLDFIEKSEVLGIHAPAYANEGIASAMLGHEDEAHQSLSRASELDENNAAIRRYVWILWQKRNDFSRVLEDFNRNPTDDPEMLVQACAAAVNCKEWGQAKALASRVLLAEGATSYERIKALEVAMHVARHEADETGLEHALQQMQAEPASAYKLIVQARIAASRGDKGLALDQIRAALDECAERLGWIGISLDACDLALSLGDFELAHTAVEPIVGASPEQCAHEVLDRYLKTLSGLRRWEKILEVEKAFERSNSPPPASLLSSVSNVHLRCGEYSAAASKLREIALGNATFRAAASLEAAYLELLGGDDSNALADFERATEGATTLAPLDQLKLATLALRFDRDQDALRIAFTAWERSPHDSEVGMGYASVFLAAKLTDSQISPTALGHHDRVILRSAQRIVRVRLTQIETQASPPEVVWLESSFGRQLATRKVGDLVAIGSTEFEIKEIESKYVAAYRDTIETFRTLYGDDANNEPLQISTDDLTPLFKILFERQRIGSILDSDYQSCRRTFSNFADSAGRSQAELWRAITTGGGKLIQHTSETYDVRPFSGGVLDELSLLSLASVGLLERSLDLDPGLVATSMTVAQLRCFLFARSRSRPEGFLGLADGKLTIQKDDATVEAEFCSFIATIIQSLESRGRVKPVPSLARLQQDMSIEELSTVFGLGASSTAVLAAALGVPAIVDDALSRTLLGGLCACDARSSSELMIAFYGSMNQDEDALESALHMLRTRGYTLPFRLESTVYWLVKAGLRMSPNVALCLDTLGQVHDLRVAIAFSLGVLEASLALLPPPSFSLLTSHIVSLVRKGRHFPTVKLYFEHGAAKAPPALKAELRAILSAMDRVDRHKVQ